MAESVDAPDSKSGFFGSGGSIPPLGTTLLLELRVALPPRLGEKGELRSVLMGVVSFLARFEIVTCVTRLLSKCFPLGVYGLKLAGF